MSIINSHCYDDYVLRYAGATDRKGVFSFIYNGKIHLMVYGAILQYNQDAEFIQVFYVAPSVYTNRCACLDGDILFTVDFFGNVYYIDLSTLVPNRSFNMLYVTGTLQVDGLTLHSQTLVNFGKNRHILMYGWGERTESYAVMFDTSTNKAITKASALLGGNFFLFQISNLFQKDCVTTRSENRYQQQRLTQVWGKLFCVATEYTGIDIYDEELERQDVIPLTPEQLGLVRTNLVVFHKTRGQTVAWIYTASWPESWFVAKIEHTRTCDLGQTAILRMAESKIFFLLDNEKQGRQVAVADKTEYFYTTHCQVKRLEIYSRHKEDEFSLLPLGDRLLEIKSNPVLNSHNIRRPLILEELFTPNISEKPLLRQIVMTLGLHLSLPYEMIWLIVENLCVPGEIIQGGWFDIEKMVKASMAKDLEGVEEAEERSSKRRKIES